MISEDNRGFCFIRKNEGGQLVTTGYGRVTGFAIDPIEKKPLSHFLPGTPVLSFGTAGCNLGCRFCQNGATSKAKGVDQSSQPVDPATIVRMAIDNDCKSVAFTNNDPTIFGEFVIDVAREARSQGIRTVMVTAGYITPEARRDIYPWIDAANVDLKAFTEQFYKKITQGALSPVKDTLRWLVRETEVWVEITTLLIPDENDSPDEIRRECDWIVAELGPEVPVHFTSFLPGSNMVHRPRTPAGTLVRARQIAMEAGLKYCYIDTVTDPEGEITFCPSCRARLIERNWYNILAYRMDGNRCPSCGNTIPGVFSEDPPVEFFGRKRLVFA